MTDTRPSLRFDHREIAVIFSLFIFVSLLMFTVGILVGKGLAQAKYEGSLNLEPSRVSSNSSRPVENPQSGTSVSKGDSESKEGAAPEKAPEPERNVAAAPSEKETKPPLELVPQKPKTPDLASNTLQEPAKNKEADDILKNPKIRALLDDAPSQKRAPASAPPAKGEKGEKAGKAEKPMAAAEKSSPGATAKTAAAVKRSPASFSSGKFTVQVGSYATQQEAAERVDALKKIGFPNAYLSTKEIGEKKDTWYRVWLGYYPTFDSAEQSGKGLQERGEVKNYIVRKADNAG